MVPQADGYVSITDVAVPPQAGVVYRAVFDATLAPDDPPQLLPALNMAGSELNALGASGVPVQDAKFAIVFHGAAVNGILSESEYEAKFGVPNPNLAAIAALKSAGVELYVCGQQLAANNVDPKTLTPDVAVASDALLVLIAYQNKGYALLSF